MLRRLQRSFLIVALAGSGAPLAQAQSLTTGLPTTGNGGVFMNLTPTTRSLYLNALTAYYNSDPGAPVTVQVWVRPGSYVGHSDYSTGWTLSQTLEGINPGWPEPYTTALVDPILIPAGTTTAVYFHATSPQARMTYTCHFSNPQTWSNSDVTLFSDTARVGAVAFGSSPSCGTFAGTIYYTPVDPNEAGACCFPDGTCHVMQPTPCVAQGGAYGGANSVCAPAQCPQPAACCFGNGTCATLLPAPCLDQGGIFYPGLDCLASPCPMPATGGCCLPNSTCTVTWIGDCSAQGGIYGGNGTTCAEPNCAHVVVPNANETLEGGHFSFYPFTYPLFPYERYQQVYGSEAFASVHGPQLIRAIQFRANRSSSPVSWHSTFDLDLRFSTTTSAAPDWISYNFATNIGGDETVVYHGPALFSTAQAGSTSDPMLFDLVISLQTPFVYDPAEGSLLIDATVDGVLAGDTRWLDAVNAEGDAVSRVISLTRGAANGTPSTMGLVTRFLLEPVTEGCYANCDGSTTAPVLNVLDFNCFLNNFAAGDSYANCDGSTTAPVLNVLDFNCFLNRFSVGCP